MYFFAVFVLLGTGLAVNGAISMKRNGRILTPADRVVSSGVRPNGDETFQRQDSVEILQSDLSTYTCEVKHQASKLHVEEKWVPEASEGIIGVAIGAVLGILLTVGVEAAVLFVLYKKGIIGLCSSSKSSLICRYNGSNSGPAVYLPPPQDSDESSTDSDRSRDEPPKLSHQALRRMKKMRTNRGTNAKPAGVKKPLLQDESSTDSGVSRDEPPSPESASLKENEENECGVVWCGVSRAKLRRSLTADDSQVNSPSALQRRNRGDRLPIPILLPGRPITALLFKHQQHRPAAARSAHRPARLAAGESGRQPVASAAKPRLLPGLRFPEYTRVHLLSGGLRGLRRARRRIVLIDGITANF